MQKLTTLSYRADIDGIRAIAVLSVVIFHAFPSMIPGGFIGVDIFFVISGYLISLIILKELSADGRFSVSRFYRRRVDRIFPALLIVLISCMALGWVDLLAHEYKQLSKHVAAGSAFVANIVYLSEVDYFDTAAELKPLLHLWSLGVEEQFYFIWPLVLILLYRSKYIFISILSIMLVSIIAGAVLTGPHQSAAFYLPVTRLWELIFGGLLAALELRKRSFDSDLSNYISLFGCALIIASLVCIDKTVPFPGVIALLPVFGAVCLISAGPHAWINKTVLSNRLIVWFGLISYPLYLWHWPLLSFYKIIKGSPLSDKNALNCILVAILLAWLTYKYVELPLKKVSGRAKTAVLAALMCLVFFSAAFVYYQDGLPERPVAASVSLEQLKQLHPEPESEERVGSCRGLLGLSPMHTNCRTNSEQPQYLFVGDSHAQALYSGIDHGDFDQRVMYMGQNACLPFVDYVTRTPSDALSGNNCLPSARELLQISKQIKSLTHAILVSRGPFYFSGSGFGIEGETSMAIYSEDGIKKPGEAAFEDGYVKLITSLRAQGKQVTFMLDWPELGINPNGCVAQRPLNFNRGVVSTRCINSVESVLNRQKRYRELVARIADKVGGLNVYDPFHVVCDDEFCRGIISGDLMYFDDDHLGQLGASRVLPSLFRAIDGSVPFSALGFD